MIEVSKIDVAKRELEFAIRSFFLQGDFVVIHLTISACQEILSQLVGKDKSMRNKMMEIIKPEKRKEVSNMFNESYNFFKHSGKDPNKVVNFSQYQSEVAMLDCIEMYQIAAKEITGLMMAFRLWFYTRNPNILVEQEQQKLYEEIGKNLNINDRRMFLDIANELENKRT